MQGTNIEGQLNKAPKDELRGMHTFTLWPNIPASHCLISELHELVDF